MKKILLSLSSITLLSLSSFLLVSCSRNTSNNTNNVVKKTDNKSSNTYKTNSDIVYKKINNKEPLNKEKIDKQIQNDEPIYVPKLSDELLNEKKNIEELLKDLSKVEEIKNYVEDQFYRNTYLKNKKIKIQKLNDYKEKVLSELFNKNDFQKIKDELIKIIKEVIEITKDSKDKNDFEQKLKTYEKLSIDRELKNGILAEMEFVFNKKISIEQESATKTEFNKFVKEVETLISQKNTTELKNKLFKLVDEISNLESK
ncbi:hypothetical protein MFERI13461_00484 [Mycoplasma feriruminatoris]|uniref:hypothetical protein n=1 Tax=Mycoplasma feriruminatoris TaxID=1179777 RepID=UPI00241FEFEE|nr:hypothetical protein [Mycoplasma feriruminatoris]WFQ91050.1 hypothetical protein MFERI13461_00484 [Mycoplasma feriruminatoris]